MHSVACHISIYGVNVFIFIYGLIDAHIFISGLNNVLISIYGCSKTPTFPHMDSIMHSCELKYELIYTPRFTYMDSVTPIFPFMDSVIPSCPLMDSCLYTNSIITSFTYIHSETHPLSPYMPFLYKVSMIISIYANRNTPTFASMACKPHPLRASYFYI